MTQGDVEAQFQALEGGGTVVFLRAGAPAREVAAPANLLENSIRPLPLWDGRSYCEADWHLLVLAISHAAGEGEPKIPRQEGEAVLEPTLVDLFLDGDQLTDTERTSIRRLIQALTIDDNGTIRAVFDGWWFQTGAFFGPDELAVGPHMLSATVTNPEGVFDVAPITFHIDAAGTGSCV